MKIFCIHWLFGTPTPHEHKHEAKTIFGSKRSIAAPVDTVDQGSQKNRYVFGVKHEVAVWDSTASNESKKNTKVFGTKLEVVNGKEPDEK